MNSGAKHLSYRQREWSTFTRSPEIARRLPTPSNDPKRMPRAVRDSLGHYASEIKSQAQKACYRAERVRNARFAQRMREVIAVIQLRIRPAAQIPDGLDEADVYDLLLVIAYHLQARYGSEETELWDRLTDWCIANCENWTAGWPSKSSLIPRLLRAIKGRSRDLTGAEAGKLLRLTWAERCDLNITTIRPTDVTPGQFDQMREERKRAIDRRRREGARRSTGAEPRKSWAWQHIQSPWTILGTSKRTWYRRKADGRLCSLVEKAEGDVPGWLVRFCVGWDRRATDVLALTGRELGVAHTASDAIVPTVAVGARWQPAQPEPDGREGLPRSLPADGAAGDDAAHLEAISATAQQEDAEPYDARCPLRARDPSMPRDGDRDAA